MIKLVYHKSLFLFWVELNKINAEFKSRSKRIAEIKSLKKTVKKAKINNKCKVYCDLINHEFGKNLLKEFTIKSDLTLFDNLTYIPLVVDNINSIRISALFYTFRKLNEINFYI